MGKTIRFPHQYFVRKKKYFYFQKDLQAVGCGYSTNDLRVDASSYTAALPQVKRMKKTFFVNYCIYVDP